MSADRVDDRVGRVSAEISPMLHRYRNRSAESSRYPKGASKSLLARPLKAAPLDSESLLEDPEASMEL